MALAAVPSSQNQPPNPTHGSHVADTGHRADPTPAQSCFNPRADPADSSPPSPDDSSHACRSSSPSHPYGPATPALSECLRHFQACAWQTNVAVCASPASQFRFAEVLASLHWQKYSHEHDASESFHCADPWKAFLREKCTAIPAHDPPPGTYAATQTVNKPVHCRLPSHQRR